MATNPNLIYRVVSSAMTHDYRHVDESGNERMFYSAKRARLMTGLSEIVMVSADEFATMMEADEVLPEEQMYLVCRQCGEAFHPEAILIAAGHNGSCGSDQGFDIEPESKAL